MRPYPATAYSSTDAVQPSANREDRIKAILASILTLLAISTAYIYLLPEGPHGDGLRWTSALEQGELQVNPNYVLLQPLLLLGYKLWLWISLPADANLFQKFVDVAAGVVALTILAMCIREFSLRPIDSILTLLLMAFSFNFLYLATSDHIKLVTAPFLMLVLLFFIRFARNSRLSILAAAGVSMALAICTLINAVIWFAALIPALLLAGSANARRRLLATGIFAASTLIPSVLILTLVYHATDASKGLLDWLASYGGTQSASDAGLSGLSPLTVARAGFAGVKNFVYSVDLGPAAKAVLVGQRMTVSSGVTLALNLAASIAIVAFLFRVVHGLWTSRSRLDRPTVLTLLVLGSSVLSFATFALLWNSGEEEFWFQITAPCVLLIALWVSRRPRSSTSSLHLAAVVLLLLVNNLLTFSVPRNSYPYDSYVRDLAAIVQPRDLVIHDGSDPVDLLIYGARQVSPAAMMSIAGELERREYSVTETLRAVESKIAAARKAGGRLYVINVFDATTLSHPWSMLYERWRIEAHPFIELLQRQGEYEQMTWAGRTIWRVSFF